MKLSRTGKQVLLALAAGWTLKSHRHLDGGKEYKLHPLESGQPQAIDWQTMDSLREAELIDSNKKFPAATYLLTDKGKAVVAAMGQDEDDLPLGASGWK